MDPDPNTKALKEREISNQWYTSLRTIISVVHAMLSTIMRMRMVVGVATISVTISEQESSLFLLMV